VAATGGGPCTPLTNAGNCCKPGRQCRTGDHGRSGADADGRPITCKDDNGWRWETT
jgi:hypothetical protein